MECSINDITILVASCDKNQDTFLPFHHCIEKYWPDHPDIIYSTEKIINPYYKTITMNYDIEHWTKRIRDTVFQINSKFILLMCDDIFIRKPVDSKQIESKLPLLDNKIAALHFEKSFDRFDEPYLNNTLMRNKNGRYQTAVCCGVWLKSALMHLFSLKDTNPWTFELANQTLDYRFLITKDSLMDWGYYDESGEKRWFGLKRGKWCKEVSDFFKKEGLEIDLSIRGLS